MSDDHAGESARLASGSDRLDAVLGGGLPRHGITLLIGQPGSGKTILAQQYLFHNATLESPAVYMSTVSEPLEKILRYGQSLRYFDPAALGRSVFYEDLGQIINDDGLPGVLARLTELIQRRRPSVLVIDSFKALLADCYQDFGPLYARLKAASDIAPGAIVAGDEVLHRGTFAYFKERSR